MQLNQKINFNQYISALEDPLSAIKTLAEKAFRKKLDETNGKYHNLLKSKISELGSMENLLLTDIKMLKQALLNKDVMQSLTASENMFEQVQSKMNRGEQVDSLEYQQVRNSLQEKKGLQEIVSLLEKHKKQWERSGLIKKIKELDVLKKEMLQDLVKDPGTITKLAKQNLNLNSLQRAFLKIDKLNLGQNVSSTSPLTVS